MPIMQLGNITKITPEVLAALGGNFEVIIEGQMQEKPIWYLPFFRDIKSTNLAIGIKLATAPLELKKWITDRILQNIGKRMKTATLETLECTVGIDRNDVLYGDLRAQIPELLKGIGDVGVNWIISQLHDYFTSGHGIAEKYIGIDGKPIFSTTHPIEKKFVASGNQSNYWADLDLTGANATTVETAMKAYKGENGIRMGVKPNVLWHSPNLKSTAKTLLEQQNLAGGESNIYYGAFERLEIEDLDTDNLWGLFDSRHVAKPFAFIHAIKTAQRWIEEPGEKKKQGSYGYDEDAGTTPLTWWALSKCVHTP